MDATAVSYKLLRSAEIKYGLEPTTAKICDIEISGVSPEPIVIENVISAQRSKTNSGKDVVAVTYLIVGKVVTKLYKPEITGLVDFFENVKP